MNRNFDFTCSAEEWAFARFYSYLFEVDNGSLFKRNPSFYSLKIFIGVTMLIIGFGGYYLFEFLAPWNNIFALFAIFAIPTVFFLILRGDRKEDINRGNAIGVVREGDVVTFLIMNHEGLGVNLLNNLSIEALPVFKWERIRKIEVDYTIHPLYIGRRYIDYKVTEEMESYFNNVKNILPGFNEIPKKRFDNRYSFYLYLEPLGLAEIQIPTSWFNNGNFEKILTKIKSFTDGRLTPIITKDLF